MSHIRDAMPHGSKPCACPRQLQGSFLTEQLPQELQCQFVLKPSRLAVTQPLNGTLPRHRSPGCLPGSATEAKRAGMRRGGGKQRGARRCAFHLHGGFCNAALPDSSVLLCVCHLHKLRFDKLPVKWLF